MLDGSDSSDCGCSAPHGSWLAGEAVHTCPILQPPTRQGPGFRVYSLVPRLTFTWGNIDASGSLEYISARYVSLHDADDAALVVRIDVPPGSGFVDIEAQGVSFSSDEPETVFVSPRPLGRLRVDDSTRALGRSVLLRLGGDLPSHLRLRLLFVRIGTPSRNTATLSADVVIRSASGRSECGCSDANDKRIVEAPCTRA